MISRSQLLALGYTRREVEQRLHNGRLHHIANGVYAAGRRELTPHGRWMAAVLACGDGAVLSHGSASELWGIGKEGRGPIHVSIRRRSRLARPGVKVHARASLPSRALTRRHRIPVTNVVQTLIDLATELPPLRLERAVNEADKCDLVDPEALRRALSGHKGMPGVKALATLLDRHTFRLSDSDLEVLFRPLALSGWPSPRPAASSTARRGAATPSGLRPCRPRRLLRQNRANVTHPDAVFFRPIADLLPSNACATEVA